MLYSLIVPVYNRPDEIEDLLSCLVKQTYKDFEIVIVESGSTIPSDEVIAKYKDQLSIQHYMYKNAGQGFSRNFGMSKAKGDYFVILDSDILLDTDYLENLNRSLSENYLDQFGGPDRAHSSFSPLQKAIDFIMTSGLTTGGIRGNKKHVGKFHPRSFNMGFSREVYEKTQGFKYPYFGEDIELSRRILSLGFNSGLIPEAYVYHKRKKKLAHYYKQMFFFGRARIQIFKLFPDTLKLTHFFPTCFTLYYTGLIPLAIICPTWAGYAAIPLALYTSLIFKGALRTHQSLKVGLLAIPALFTQMTGYGLGFLKDFVRRVIFGMGSHIDNKKE